MLKRLIGVCFNSFKYDALKSSGLASRVISFTVKVFVYWATLLIRRLISLADNNDGVPPPKYMVVICCPCNSGFRSSISFTKASTISDLYFKLVLKWKSQ